MNFQRSDPVDQRNGDGVPLEYRTMVVIPALLAVERDAPFLLRRSETTLSGKRRQSEYFLCPHHRFCRCAGKGHARRWGTRCLHPAAIAALNKKYGSGSYEPFYFFHRERTWNASEERWMGWERKRGKLEEFNRLLMGSEATTFNVRVGDLSLLRTIRYVITLDADTMLPARSRPPVDRHAGASPSTRRSSIRPMAWSKPVTPSFSGQDTGPACCRTSRFLPRVFPVIPSSTCIRAVSDVYQDLFDEGNYVGKGIYDVEASRRSLDDKIPENHLLSHDLFEGMQGRCGLVMDVVLFEDYPPHYLLYTNRLHRWIRGDWRLLPWLGYAPAAPGPGTQYTFPDRPLEAF